MKEMKDCKYCCQYYDHYLDNDYFYIIMEKCDGDLKDLLEQNNIQNDESKKYNSQRSKTRKYLYKI